MCIRDRFILSHAVGSLVSLYDPVVYSVHKFSWSWLRHFSDSLWRSHNCLFMSVSTLLCSKLLTLFNGIIKIYLSHCIFFCCFSFVCRYCFRHCWLIVKQGIRSGKTAPAAFTDFSGDRQTSEDNLPSTNLPSHPRKWLLKCVNVWLCLSFIHEAIFTYYVSNGTLKSLSLSQSVMQNMFSLQNFPPIIHSSSNSWKTCFGWSIGTVLY